MKHKLKPFEPVLARTSENAKWFATFYGGHTVTNNNEIYYTCCGGGHFRYCIPYNENTAHLVGTNEPYKEPKPKEWQIMGTGYNDLLTAEELINFIQGAVINNKDITDFRIRYTGQ